MASGRRPPTLSMDVTSDTEATDPAPVSVASSMSVLGIKGSAPVPDACKLPAALAREFVRSPPPGRDAVGICRDGVFVSASCARSATTVASRCPSGACRLRVPSRIATPCVPDSCALAATSGETPDTCAAPAMRGGSLGSLASVVVDGTNEASARPGRDFDPATGPGRSSPTACKGLVSSPPSGFRALTPSALPPKPSPALNTVSLAEPFLPGTLAGTSIWPPLSMHAGSGARQAPASMTSSSGPGMADDAGRSGSPSAPAAPRSVFSSPRYSESSPNPGSRGCCGLPALSAAPRPGSTSMAKTSAAALGRLRVGWHGSAQARGSPANNRVCCISRFLLQAAPSNTHSVTSSLPAQTMIAVQQKGDSDGPTAPPGRNPRTAAA